MRLSAALVRGGTSKCWIFHAPDPRRDDWEGVLVRAFGSADPRQIDGVGGATPTTSKAALVGPSAEPGVDVDYTFAQVGIGREVVEWGSNCGNCATAVGLHAVQSGLVAARDDATAVRIRNRNTGALLTVVVPTPGGAAPDGGDGMVPGVTGTGVPVTLSFVDPIGTTTGTLLPAGEPTTALRHGTAPATLVDAGTPAALVDAAALGLTGAEPADALADAIPPLTLLRRQAALAMGLVREDDPVSHAIPKIGVVGPPADYQATDGRTVRAADHDLSVRMLSMHSVHPAIGLTAAVAVAVAATTPGSVPAACPRHHVDPGRVRLGTPAGVVEVRLERDATGAVRAATLRRAARWIADAELNVPEPTLVPAEPVAPPVSA
ncbi:PrpF domain-containing protein [Saccharopolyspora rosea]|uniref:PrpF domain-containing protein n=1 Tax=Saccharopolyspora rosea TaxID=524884 RepID=A0ABW3G365_9PSEU|nr:PrpF domain-containing protein [Saccharopolyspora rosea]